MKYTATQNILSDNMDRLMREKLYRLEEGEEDSWKNGLIPDGDRFAEYLGEESLVFRGIKEAGELFLRARKLVAEIEEAGMGLERNDLPEDSGEDKAVIDRAAEDIPEDLADKVCEALSNFGRNPHIRFFEVSFFRQVTVTLCIMKRWPEKFSQLPWTDAQYHAVVCYAFMNHIALTMGPKHCEKESLESEVIRAFEACLKARPNDARMYVSFGNFLMVNGFSQDAREHFEKAIELDEKRCFGSHYSLANLLENITPDTITYNTKLSPWQQLQARSYMEGAQIHLKKYLDLAPIGHWHRHRAFNSLFLNNVKLTANGNEKVESIEKRNPGFSANQFSLFEDATKALKLYVNCFGREQKDFKSLFKQTACIVTLMQKAGLLENSQAPECEYICGNPDCVEIKNLKECARCSSIRYYSKKCQTKHWKSGHKKECKRMAREYEEQRKIQKLKRPEFKGKQVGDDPCEFEELFKM